ncbi:dihydrofolate reductase family protein [Streptomyces sp. NPDC007083]|uniref:dihydrofolate reductase family protein n=1 Tax=unclassified Streptomyces TaxID=2593676 RepID=UPI0033CDE447
MRKLVYYVAVTIDGFIAGPQGEYDFFPVPDDFVAATVENLPETLPTPARAAMGLSEAPNRRFDTVLMGRGTYEPALSQGVTSPYAQLRQIVFSRTLPPETDPAVEIVRDRDPVEVVQELKQQQGQDIWLAGGGKLAGPLLEEIDELMIKRSPRLACAGVPLFDGAFAPTPFLPVATRDFASGISMTTYERER